VVWPVARDRVALTSGSGVVRLWQRSSGLLVASAADQETGQPCGVWLHSDSDVACIAGSRGHLHLYQLQDMC
jgi:hypothetical protein